MKPGYYWRVRGSYVEIVCLKENGQVLVGWKSHPIAYLTEPGVELIPVIG